MLEKKIDINYIISNFLKLYRVFETHAWEHENIKINIDIKELNFSVKIFNNGTIVDDIGINFKSSERKVYEYFVSFVFVKLFENVIVSYDEVKGLFYNSSHMNYLSVRVLDNNMLNKCIEIVGNINSYQNEDIYNELEEDYFKIKKGKRKVKKKYDDNIDDRIYYTKKLIKEGFYE